MGCLCLPCTPHAPLRSILKIGIFFLFLFILFNFVYSIFTSSILLTFIPNNRWVFEKLDGVRAIWDSQNRLMYSRWGKLLQVPNYILDTLPMENWLDGEISTINITKSNKRI